MPVAHKCPDACSGGQQQRSAVARALANDPQADGPTGPLDTRNTAAELEILRDPAHKSCSVITITHGTEDRCIRMAGGRIVRA
jgi:ABC-type lipoprotein export system ATPase subunit